MSEIAPAQMQHLALGLVELHEALVGPLLRFVQVCLEGTSTTPEATRGNKEHRK